MHNNPSHQDVTVEIPRPLIMLGSALIISGLMITCYIAAQVLQIYHATDLNPFVLHIRQLLSNKELITVNGQAIIIGEASAITSAIALFAVLAWVGISIGIGLIRAGANIVSPVFRTELATLKLRLTELTKRINKNE